MKEHKLLVAYNFYTGRRWATNNRWKFIPGRPFQDINGNTLSYVHNRESMMGYKRGVKVYLHDSWNKRPDRDELAMEMLVKQMDVEKISD